MVITIDDKKFENIVDFRIVNLEEVTSERNELDHIKRNHGNKH